MSSIEDEQIQINQRETIIGLITARGGSKSIPRKNVKLLAGQPLIAWSIESALRSRGLSRLIVSTDDEEIAKVSKKFGAEIPCLRPKELAQDDTLSLPVLQHMVRYLREKENYEPFAVILLQPTSPLRTEKHIDEAIELFQKDSQADSLVSVATVPHNFQPQKLMKLSDKYLIPYLEGEGTEILTRKGLPKLFARNGPAILISKTNLIIEQETLYGEKILPYLMPMNQSFDIDDMEDWKIIESIMKND